MAALRVQARAKINLDLRVVGRRPDGYHELRTVFQALDLHDTVTVTSTRGALRLLGDASRMPLDSTNLAWRAAEALWHAAGRPGGPHGVRIDIVKRIPSAAGLGGGSSDAAAVLAALNEVWKVRLPLAALQQVASGLGADVAFFLVGGTALGLGRGDEIYPLVDLPVRPVVVAWPAEGVASTEAYAWLSADRAAARPHDIAPDIGGLAPIVEGAVGRPDMLGMLAGQFDELRNDLEGAVEIRRPAIAEIRQFLTRQGAAAARMSGSGSAVFGLFADDDAAKRAASAVLAHGWQGVATRTRRRLAGTLGGR